MVKGPKGIGTNEEYGITWKVTNCPWPNTKLDTSSMKNYLERAGQKGSKPFGIVYLNINLIRNQEI